jgi:hypothetical protein
MVTWRAGWGWRFLDVVLILPSLLLTWCVAMAAWISAPTHLFPQTKLAVFASLYLAAALVGVWGIFGRRPARQALTLPSSEVSLIEERKS